MSSSFRSLTVACRKPKTFIVAASEASTSARESTTVHETRAHASTTSSGWRGWFQRPPVQLPGPFHSGVETLFAASTGKVNLTREKRTRFLNSVHQKTMLNIIHNTTTFGQAIWSTCQQLVKIFGQQMTTFGK